MYRLSIIIDKIGRGIGGCMNRGQRCCVLYMMNKISCTCTNDDGMRVVWIFILIGKEIGGEDTLTHNMIVFELEKKLLLSNAF